MNKSRLYVLTALLGATGILAAQNTPASQMERLDRGVVALPAASGAGNFVSWRLLGTDDEEMTTFDVLRNGSSIATGMYRTNFVDANGTAGATYQVVTRVNGVAQDTTKAVKAWAQRYMTLPVNRPAGGTHRWREYDSSTKKYGSWQNNVAYDYSPNDCSVGDVDGDGEYEIVLKWDPSHSQDNSFSCGYSGSVYLDCYKLDGTQLWRIDLGDNIRAGAHYTQFLVYDFDGDGKAEVMCKTAPGSKDGQGNYVNQAATSDAIKGESNTTDYRNETGQIMQGPEYLTVFNGETGAALHTIYYLPNRAGELNKVSAYPGSSYWGDNYANRSERYLAAVAYLDGAEELPAGVFCRGYYTRAFVWAVGFDGQQLHTKWLSDSESSNYLNLYVGDELAKQPRKAYTKNTSGVTSKDSSGGIAGSCTMYSNGNHNLSIADVDGDGCDEILWGAAALNNDGYMLYATGYGHGDAIHLSDLMPDRPGLELFDIHEEKLTAAHGSWDLHDAATGEIIYHGGSAGVDNGRGLAADVASQYRGFEFWSSDERNPASSATGKTAISANPTVNFRIYWDGDLQDELLDDKKIDKFNNGSFSRLLTLSQFGNSADCNSTKHTPNLQADILGDWREEVILWDSSNSSVLNIFTTNTTTDYRMPTLMHDHVYRMGIAWQQTAYNQPPHLGYYLPDAMLPHFVGEKEVTTEKVTQKVDFSCRVRYATDAYLKCCVLPNGKVENDFPDYFDDADYSARTKTAFIKGYGALKGDYKFVFELTGFDKKLYTDTLTVHNGTGTSGIDLTTSDDAARVVAIFDMAGRQLPITQPALLPRGVYVLKTEGTNGVRTRKIVRR